MIGKDYLKELSLPNFFALLDLEESGSKKTLEELDGTDLTAIKARIVNNKKKKLKGLLKGFGMEHLWNIDEYTLGNQEKRFPPYILLFFRRIMRSEIKGTFIGKISKVQNAMKKDDEEKLKQVLATVTDEDIVSFAKELRKDYNEWKRTYRAHYNIKENDYENWVREITDNTNGNGSGDTWDDLGAWYHERSEKKESLSTKQTKPERSEKRGLTERKRHSGKMERRLDELVSKIRSNEKLRESLIKSAQEPTDRISDEQVERMLEFRAEEVNMARMLDEVTLLIRQKRTLAAIQAQIHRELDEVIQRVYDLKTITEQQFELLVPHEVKSLEDDMRDESDTERTDKPCYVNLPMLSLREGDLEEERQSKKLWLTNRHKLIYLRLLSKDLKKLCESKKANIDWAMNKLREKEKSAIFDDNVVED